jgi:hypothetical protein
MNQDEVISRFMTSYVPNVLSPEWFLHGKPEIAPNGQFDVEAVKYLLQAKLQSIRIIATLDSFYGNGEWKRVVEFAKIVLDCMGQLKIGRKNDEAGSTQREITVTCGHALIKCGEEAELEDIERIIAMLDAHFADHVTLRSKLHKLLFQKTGDVKYAWKSMEDCQKFLDLRGSPEPKTWRFMGHLLESMAPTSPSHLAWLSCYCHDKAIEILLHRNNVIQDEEWRITRYKLDIDPYMSWWKRHKPNLESRAIKAESQNAILAWFNLSVLETVVPDDAEDQTGPME